MTAPQSTGEPQADVTVVVVCQTCGAAVSAGQILGDDVAHTPERCRDQADARTAALVALLRSRGREVPAWLLT